MDGTRRQTLLTLEIGRFVASAAVLLYHYTTLVADFRGVIVFGDMFRPGHVGVPYFFVLSGFIMHHVHRRDIGTPGAVRRFAVKRAVRLYPMFWAVSLVMLAGFLLVPGLSAQRSLNPVGVVADLALLPRANAILAISWTLRHEIIFYGLFALVLVAGRRAFWLIAAWIALSLFLSTNAALGGSLGGWSVIASTLNLGFGLGLLTSVMLGRRPDGPALPWIAAGAGGLILLGVLEWRLGQGVPHDVVVLGAAGDVGYLLAAAALIFGLVRFEARHAVRWPAVWKTLGGASYLLYLIHQPVGSIAIRALPPLRTLPPEVAFLILAALSVAGALALHLTVERWVLAWLRGLTARAAAGIA